MERRGCARGRGTDESLGEHSERPLGVAEWSHRLVHGTRSAPGEPFTWSRIDYDPASSPSMELIRGFGTDQLWVWGSNPFGERGHPARRHHDREPTGWRLELDDRVVHDPLLNASVSLQSFWVTSGNELWIAGNGSNFAGAVAHGVPSSTNPSDYTWTEVLNALRAIRDDGDLG